MDFINQKLNITRVKGSRLTFTEDHKRKSYLLMPSEAIEILALMNELNFSIEKCFERLTGKPSDQVSNIFLELKIS